QTIAVWLLALVISPFTAPFSICDLSSFGRAAHRDGSGAPASARLPHHLPDTSLAPCGRAPRTPGRFRLILFDGASPQAVSTEPSSSPVRSTRTRVHARVTLCPAVLRI